MRVLIRRVDLDKFEALLNERRMSHEDLARETGLSKSFINYLANGERNPRRDSAERIAEALQVPTDQFLVEEWVPRRRRTSQPDCTTGAP